MWNVLARAGVTAAGLPFIKETNPQEVYVDRIKRDFRIPDYYDAWNLYNADLAYWARYYTAPSHAVDPKDELVRDSAARAGIPSRRNVFEYGYLERGPGEPSAEGGSLGRASGGGASFADRFGNLAPSQAHAPRAPGEAAGSSMAGSPSSVRSADIRRLTRMPPTGR